MQRPRPLSLVLGSTAFAGWVLFILACTGWPGWSPDGKQLLFPYLDQKANAAGVALYDRQQKTVIPFYLGQTSAGTNESVPAAAQWSQDGKQILLHQGFENNDRYTMEVLGILVNEKYPIRSLSVASNGLTDWPPLTEVKGTLYVAFNGITALDLTTWRKRQESVGNYAMNLFAMGDQVLYVAAPQEEDQKPAPSDGSQPSAEQAQQEKKPPPVPLEFGELDQTDLSRHAWFTITDLQVADFAKCAGADLKRKPAVDPGLGRMAFTLTCPDEPDAILVLDKNGMQRVIRPRAEGNFRLTDPQWSRDGRSLYAGLYVPGEGQEKGRYGVAEVALDTETVRVTPISKLGVSSDDYHNGIRVSLSPDGSMIATSTALLDGEGDIDREDVALYIVDLRDPQRGVTKIHPPHWEPTPPAEKAP